MNNDNQINFQNQSHEKEVIKKTLDETKEKVSKERNDKKKLTIILVTIIGVLIVLVASFVIYGFYNKKTLYTFDQYEIYQYFSGIKTTYEGKVTINSDGQITKIEGVDTKVENISDAPIYFQKEANAVFFAKNMGLIIPRIKNKNYKIDYFSKITVDEKNAYVENKGDSSYIEPSFIYDGENLYFFLYETTVTIENKDYKLSPLSYIIVNYQGQIEIYDKANDKYTTIDSHKKDVLSKTESYTINLSTDVISYADGESKLFVKSFNSLETYKFVKNK